MSLTKVTYSMIQGAPVNVLDLGADLTGVADSTTAIQTAINTGAAYLPAGTYKVTASLTLRTGCKIQGAGADSTAIVMTGSFPIFVNDPAITPDFAKTSLEDITLRAGTYAHKYTLTGVNVQSLGDWSRVRFENQTIRAIDCDQFFIANNFYDCVFSYCGGAIQCGKVANINNFFACRFEGMTTNTIVYLDGTPVGSPGTSRGGEVNNFIGCRFEARANSTDAGYSVAILKGCIDTIFQGCYFEDTWKVILAEENATAYNSTMFRDCKFSGQEVSVAPAGAKSEKFDSTGIVNFENNFFEFGSDGTSTASLRLIGSNIGLNTAASTLYPGVVTLDNGVAITKPWTPVVSTAKNLFTVSRTDLTNSVNNVATVGGQLKILVQGFDSIGTPFSLSRSYPFNVFLYTNSTVVVTIGTPVLADSNLPPVTLVISGTSITASSATISATVTLPAAFLSIKSRAEIVWDLVYDSNFPRPLVTIVS